MPDYVKALDKLRKLGLDAWDGHHPCLNCRGPVKDEDGEFCDEVCEREFKKEATPPDATGE